jgi:hypothetical protein
MANKWSIGSYEMNLIEYMENRAYTSNMAKNTIFVRFIMLKTDEPNSFGVSFQTFKKLGSLIGSVNLLSQVHRFIPLRGMYESNLWTLLRNCLYSPAPRGITGGTLNKLI